MCQTELQVFGQYKLEKFQNISTARKKEWIYFKSTKSSEMQPTKLIVVSNSSILELFAGSTPPKNSCASVPIMALSDAKSTEPSFLSSTNNVTLNYFKNFKNFVQIFEKKIFWHLLFFRCSKTEWTYWWTLNESAEMIFSIAPSPVPKLTITCPLISAIDQKPCSKCIFMLNWF